VQSTHVKPAESGRLDRVATLWIPIPDHDFDVTEVAVPWKLFIEAGHRVVFATERAGTRAAADPRLLDGVIFGQLGAADEAKRFYAEMIESDAYRDTRAWSEFDVNAFDAIMLPGGHAPGMKQYLGSEVLHRQVAAFWATGKPVGAICHGTIVLARSRNESGKSVMHASRTTCLPTYMEALAYGLTFWKLGRYYRTYPSYVEDEVRSVLDDASRQFERGPVNLGARGTRENDAPTFVVEDGRYVSARWPGDAYAFARAMLKRV
jgi:putative intracellular protease/amidase